MHAPRLIGRDDELNLVVRALSGAREGRGSTIFVIGEAGIGKSRLAAETVARAEAAGMVVLKGRATAVGPMVPFRPLVEALLSRFRHRNLPPERELGPYRAVLGRLVPEWAADELTSGDDSVVVLGEAMLRLLALVGRGHGCVLVVEDLQHADAGTLAVLEYLADQLVDESNVLLATCRTEQSLALRVATSVALRPTVDLIELRPLDEDQVWRLAAACLQTDDVPVGMAHRLWERSAGIPFVVEELLASPVELSASLVRFIAERADRLGPRGRRVLSAAAVLGTVFPLQLVQQLTGLDEPTLHAEILAAAAAQLVLADERRPGWYCFQQPLLAEALLARMTPADRAEHAARAADAITEIDPELSGDWGQLAAELRLAAGDSTTAARLLTEAGRRALAHSAADSAIALLDKAAELLPAHEPGRVEVLETLLYALAEAGQFDRAARLAGALDTDESGLSVGRRVAVRIRLAWVAQLAGRYEDCAAQVSEARIALGPDGPAELRAPVDAISAHLALELPGRDRIREAEAFARRALPPAEGMPLPAVACQAWYAIGVIRRGRDLAESDTALRRTLALAEEHRLPRWRLYGLGGLATNSWLAESGAEALEHARREALHAGAVSVALDLESLLALHSVLCGDFPAAGRFIDERLSTVRRLQLVALERQLLVTRAVAAAHQAKREEMELALAEFLRRGGATSREYPLSAGLARGFCALLEENPELAEHDLAGVLASEDENPVTCYLTGRHGLYPLIRVLSRRMDWAELTGNAHRGVTGMRWNRHFHQLAQAVLLGRAGERDRAEAMMARAWQSGAPYAMARHLGLRLIAEAAIADGWGSPLTWLRAGEEYFHEAGVPAVAAACRALLRRHGAFVPQRRTGTERIPVELRERGVTVREFEVLELLILRLGNKSIGARLHISPRTVEKHVASLLLKVDQPGRAALIEYGLARTAAWARTTGDRRATGAA